MLYEILMRYRCVIAAQTRTEPSIMIDESIWTSEPPIPNWIIDCIPQLQTQIHFRRFKSQIINRTSSISHKSETEHRSSMIQLPDPKPTEDSGLAHTPENFHCRWFYHFFATTNLLVHCCETKKMLISKQVNHSLNYCSRVSHPFSNTVTLLK